MAVEKIRFSVNRYDRDGDLYEEGIYLEVGPSSLRVCSHASELAEVLYDLRLIYEEIERNYADTVPAADASEERSE